MAKERIKAGQRIAKPLAIVFTKMDALLHDLKETSPLLRPPPHMPYFDERDSLEVHTEIQRLLARWEGSQDRSDRAEELPHLPLFRRIRARRDADPAKTAFPPRGIRPYRVAGPFTWMLAQFGTVPVEARLTWRFSSSTTPPARPAWPGTAGISSMR